jgi:hypothetical protein
VINSTQKFLVTLVTLRDEHRLLMTENCRLKEIFGLKEKEVCRKVKKTLHVEELHNFVF